MYHSTTNAVLTVPRILCLWHMRHRQFCRCCPVLVLVLIYLKLAWNIVSAHAMVPWEAGRLTLKGEHL